MQRQVLQAACRPGCPDAMRAARISFQTTARAGMLGVMRAVDRNRTARVVADRLDGLSLQRHDALRHGLTDLLHCSASVHRQALEAQRCVPVGGHITPHAHTPISGFRMRIPSRGCDARCTLQPVFEHTSHPAPRRATRTTPIRVAALAERARAA
ncbi:hypothetical protein [Burkholderia lata]|uniref:Uncharacterized protein n=1 Tax=Burkholderia lata (strain ATCC 17760 / DSM 23089 / LMG 22485 / NCIMB 9086 / R18194 / 383) TaxID=482957 RepID=A0A6P2YT82_BURL3|nr:hypothetical protein [Burkholderia lata]VWD23788.1 hypothetical protein BLA18109_06142 [Burkholderia lata]